MQARFLTLLLPLLLAPACTHSKPGDPPLVDHRPARQLAAAIQADAATAVQGNTAFALDLYGRIKGSAGNLFCSPYSISTGLAMTWAGARGVTEAEMAGVLHFTLPQDRLHPAFGALQKSLDTGNGFSSYQLSIANRLFGQQGKAWQAPFLAITRDQYGAQLQELDFAGAPEPSRQTINQWVLDRTAGCIPDLFPAGSLDSSTKLVLADAIYFKGRWASRFDAQFTRNADFQLGSGARVTVPFMNQTLKARAWDDGSLTVAELPYEGQDMAMLILLPAAVDGLPALESRLSPANLSLWRESLREAKFNLSLPRFSVLNAFSLAQVLSAMGMPSAFDARSADLSGMDGIPDLMLQKVLHKAMIKVDEEGTVAAAATGVSVGPTSAMPLSIKVDRPFLFLLMDQVTGSILFLGRVVDPSQG